MRWTYFQMDGICRIGQENEHQDIWTIRMQIYALLD